MATTVPTNIVSVYDVGLFNNITGAHHEDLTDVLTILDSAQTPGISTLPKTRARDVVHSWVVDSLTATSTAGSTGGGDFLADAMTTPSRLNNTCQVFRRDIVVEDRERVSNPAGIRDMYEYQVMKEFKVLMRNSESALFKISAQGSTTGAENTPSILAGLRGFAITTQASAGGAAGSGSIITLSQTMFTNGAEPDSVWFGPAAKRQFLNNTLGTGGTNVRNIAATDRRLIANVDVFETPFNQLYVIITDRFIPEAAASETSAAYFVGDRSMAKIAMFRTPRHIPMGKNGDHTRGVVLMDWTLQLDHPSSWGAVVQVTNA